MYTPLRRSTATTRPVVRPTAAAQAGQHVFPVLERSGRQLAPAAVAVLDHQEMVAVDDDGDQFHLVGGGHGAPPPATAVNPAVTVPVDLSWRSISASSIAAASNSSKPRSCCRYRPRGHGQSSGI